MVHHGILSEGKVSSDVSTARSASQQFVAAFSRPSGQRWSLLVRKLGFRPAAGNFSHHTAACQLSQLKFWSAAAQLPDGTTCDWPWRTKVLTQKVSSGLWAMMWPHIVAVKGEHEWWMQQKTEDWLESLNRAKTQILPPGIQAVGQQWKEKQIFWRRRRQKPWAGPNARINTVIESSKTSINQLLHLTFHSNSNWTVVNHIEDVNLSLGQAVNTLKRSTKQFEWICPSNCCVARREKKCRATQQNNCGTFAYCFCRMLVTRRKRGGRRCSNEKLSGKKFDWKEVGIIWASNFFLFCHNMRPVRQFTGWEGLDTLTASCCHAVSTSRFLPFIEGRNLDQVPTEGWLR